MATIVTHAYVGCLLVPLAPAVIPRAPLFAVLALLAMLPDVDVAAFALGIPYAHPLGHRGFTHSLLFAALAGVATAGLFRRYLRGPARQSFALTTVFSVAMASHGILDALTDAGRGVGFFIPLSNRRYFFPWRPLETSPPSLTGFFTENPWSILVTELLWVWIPATVLAAFACLLRRRARRA